ncbi:MAG TPA: molybdate ABC transporter permease subunit [Spirochaetia bacterium]|nr:MAG: molybdenum ABC transporter permease subunit [Spirochaetes bacterium GWB1_36_13]HCL56210.1 molybdate ABC transporter permease subunit [Spirochaetia bacterium]
MDIDLSPFLISFKLAFLTVLILFFIGMALGYFLAFSKSKLKPVFETLLNMPMILPPSVLGFYFLVLFSPDTFINRFFHLSFAFTFEGLLIASVLFNLPFMIQPVYSALKNLPESLSEASYTLGKSKWATFIHVLLPNIKPSVLSGIVMTFAHTVGEFGVVLMIGGNIPGKTRTISIAIYNEMESLNYTKAHLYSGILLVFSFAILLILYLINQKKSRGEIG